VINRDTFAPRYARLALLQCRVRTLTPLDRSRRLLTDVRGPDAAEMFALTHCELKIWEGEWRTKYSTVSGPNEKIVSGLYHVHRVYSRLHFAKRRVEVVESRCDQIPP
jgi:hypothetical protein